MAKTKKNHSDLMRRRSMKNKSVSKFEIKVNKQKHHVLGQKLSKYDRGMPGVSKSKSIKKRMETLLVEYQKLNKANQFLDHRVDEKEKNLSEDAKAIRRLKLSKKNLYNLNDDDDFNYDDDCEDDDKNNQLTHAGKSLSQIENFDDDNWSYGDDDDDDDDENKGKISGKIVAEEHFGGFMKAKQDKKDDGEGGENSGEVKKVKSHADRMAEIIMDSIIKKNQRKREKFEHLKQVEELNANMKNVLPQLNIHLRKDGEDDGKNEKPDSLDIKMRMLHFLPKGTPSDRLKSKEEIDRLERERLKKSEEERIERMKGDPKVKGSSAVRVHQSADDLNDDYWLPENKRKDKKVSFAG
ncbi:hypothetical protein HELRODRAFT_193948 [Helobdella robusta]|uniref:Uncharacterized protein n=1 Tax=Helobdella robusta TaxID=6412 RepID=T1FVI5_HELRO|nr:hypothetical protein HELRODRAFT_193948 [Helobdella robusta]ESN93747.1 hypothetical protein HELRODRAFT_193948 [Helobdella robusta]